MDPARLSCRQKTAKMTAATMLVVPFLIVFGMTVDLWNNAHKLAWRDPASNATTDCDYSRTFPLTKTLHVGIFVHRGALTIDLRRLANNRPTLTGIQLDAVQWNYLKRTLPLIDRALQSRRDYSRDITGTPSR